MHPGTYIREKVIPAGMSVKDAAKLLDVGRPALSNLLNGNAALSPEMAARIERTFGVNARTLLDLQAAHDSGIAAEKGVAASAKTYVPPFMQFKANDIENWASSIKARTRFAVLLRTLVNSTGLKLEAVDFPGNDDAERPGWDGFVSCSQGTPWVPEGQSGWEFGVTEDPRKKAEKDYKKSVAQHSATDRLEITFVFVTPVRWPGKASWQKSKEAEKNWKSVRVYDSSDIEQWLEQSIPGQAWLAGELRQPADGVLSLDGCWSRWTADCTPPLTESLFSAAVARAKPKILRKLSGSTVEPIIIAGDSTDEALAFLHCLFAQTDPEFAIFRDRVAVFTQANALTKLAAKHLDFIAVIVDREVERQFAPLKADIRSIIVYPRNVAGADVDVLLEPLREEDFRLALEAQGCNRDHIEHLAQLSGRSLTILRRQLSKLEAIRAPTWASDPQIFSSLRPFIFAGAWTANNDADRAVLSLLANDLPYESLEAELASLCTLSDSPVWSVGYARGVVSKLDAFYAIQSRLIWTDIERFLNVAKLVLSEDDPALDLPEKDRWAAGIWGKKRDISSTLRRSIGDTLILLAVHGNSLLQTRLGHDLEAEIGSVVRSVLTPLTARTLESQSGDLPIYAEAAPADLLKILETDLSTDEPQSLSLMRPVTSGVFGSNPRTGLLWALELLAWSPEYLIRVVRLLAQLASPELDDNWANKPTASLSAILRCWMPQTTAPLDARKRALEYLVREFPKVAWRLCVEQFDGRSSIGHYSYKPRWRTNAHGSGEPVSRNEANDFALHALELAIGWQSHGFDTLGDLVSCVGQVPLEHQAKIWQTIERWSETANDTDKAILREKVRVEALSKRARKANKQAQQVQRQGQAIYQLLRPRDIIAMHEWLFKKDWIEETLDEIQEDALDYEQRSVRIEEQRIAALRQILSERDIIGIVDLASRGETRFVIGWLLSKIMEDQTASVDIVTSIMALGPLSESPVRQAVICGLLHGLVSQGRENVLRIVVGKTSPADTVMLLLQAPFERLAWSLVEELAVQSQIAYWSTVTPRIPRNETSSNLEYAINHLLDSDRPRAAFAYARFEMKSISSALLFRLLKEIATGAKEAADTFQIRDYEIGEAFKRLTQSGEIPIDQMAGLEFLYIEALTGHTAQIPNLEQQVLANPELFVQAVAMIYRRSDGADDPEELRAPTQKVEELRAQAAYRLLDNLSKIPGCNDQGIFDENLMRDWVEKALSMSESLSRRETCETCLGQLFSRAPVGEDGVWPCEPAREVIERVTTDRFASGLRMGLYNARGVHWRREGGDDERALAEKYERWAAALEFSYPRVSAILRELASSYLREATEHDADAMINRRLLRR